MRLAYTRHGDGPPLIVLHGMLGSSDNWQTLSRTAFSKHFTVYALDQRNHGQSPHRDVMDVSAMAEDVIAFMNDHDLASARLLGHSMGGKTAMHTALTYPDRVDALVVVDIAPKPYPPRHDPIFDALRGLDLAAYDSRTAINDALRPEIPDASVRNFLLKNLKRDESGGYAWQINLDGIYRNYHEINGGLKADGVFDGPTLFVRGGASDYIADEDTETIISFFPEADIITIEEAGHWVHSEKPDAFADVVLDFLGA